MNMVSICNTGYGANIQTWLYISIHGIITTIQFRSIGFSLTAFNCKWLSLWVLLFLFIQLGHAINITIFTFINQMNITNKWCVVMWFLFCIKSKRFFLSLIILIIISLLRIHIVASITQRMSILFEFKLGRNQAENSWCVAHFFEKPILSLIVSPLKDQSFDASKLIVRISTAAPTVSFRKDLNFLPKNYRSNEMIRFL